MRDQQTGWISLHPGEFFVVWTSLGLGEPPSALGVPHLGRTQQARAEFVAAAGEAMAERELGTVERPAADLEGFSRTIAAAERRLELDVDIPDASLRAVGAVDGRTAAAAASLPTEVRVGPARDQPGSDHARGAAAARGGARRSTSSRRPLSTAWAAAGCRRTAGTETARGRGRPRR